MIKKNLIIGFFGLGIFTYLCISSLSYLLEEFIRDSLIYFNLHPLFNLLITELLSFAIFILPILYFIKKVSRNHELFSSKISKYLVWSFVIFILLQIIQIAYPSIKSLLFSDWFTNEETKYYQFLREYYALYYLKSAVYFLALIVSFLLIHKEVKSVVKTVSYEKR